MKRKLPLGACLKAGVAFLPRAYAHAWGGILLASLVQSAPLFVMLFAPQHAASAAFFALWFAAVVAVCLVRDGGLYRLGVGGSPQVARELALGPAGLQFGPPEIRLLAGGLLVGLFLLLIAIAGFVVSLFVASAAGLSEVNWSEIQSREAFLALGEPWKLAMVAAAPVGAALILLALSIQFLLYAPATVGRRRVVSLDAMGLAEGNVARLLAGLVVIYLPTLALIAARAWSGQGETPLFMAAEFLVAGLLQAPLTIGFLSAAYRALEYVKPLDVGGEDHG